MDKIIIPQVVGRWTITVTTSSWPMMRGSLLSDFTTTYKSHGSLCRMHSLHSKCICDLFAHSLGLNLWLGCSGPPTVPMWYAKQECIVNIKLWFVCTGKSSFYSCTVLTLPDTSVGLLVTAVPSIRIYGARQCLAFHRAQDNDEL